MDARCEPKPIDGGADDFRALVRAEGPRIVVTVSGEVDLASRAALEKALLDAISRAGQGVIADLASVTFIDSSGVRTVIDAHDAALRKGSVLTLRSPPPNVTRVFELLGLTDRLNFGNDQPNKYGPGRRETERDDADHQS